jgi:hypothetical protein
MTGHRRIWLAVLLGLALAGLGGCGSDTGSGSGPTQPEQDSGPAVDTSADATPDAASDTGSDATRDTEADSSRDTGTSCPSYQSLCDGACIPTSNDPDNCGGCGLSCDGGEVCSGGTCTDSCMDGLTDCDGHCVDLRTDNDHCGGCNNACDDGDGCVGQSGATELGRCETAVDVGDRGGACAGGGPTIDLGSVVTEEHQCTGNLAERTFRWAMCSCEDVRSTSRTTADAYDSSVGPYTPGGEGGGIASNGVIGGTDGIAVTGTLWAADAQAEGAALDFTGASEVGQRLHAGSSVSTNSGVDVGEDAYVEGDFNSTNSSHVAGTLHIPQDATIDSSVSYGDIDHGPVDVTEPCGECAPDDRIPVADIVAAHSANNDNAAIGLDPDVFNNSTGAKRLDLPCGRYYLTSIEGTSAPTIVAHGNTALLIGGDIDTTQEVTISLTPDAQLDIFVAGSVEVTGGLNLGSPNYPASLRVYIGGQNGFRTTSRTEVSGFFYAVPGGINITGGMEVFGGVYTQSIGTTSGNDIHFDRHVLVAGESCPSDGPNPGGNLCATQAQECASSDDCCSPLSCSDEGECVLLGCTPLGSACDDHEECCSGSCNGSICVGG